MKHRQRRYDRNIQRREAQHQSDGKTFLIVVEGKQTERRYLDGLRQRLELKSAHVEICHAGATDPQNMVKEAIRLRDNRVAAARHSPVLVEYDEVWLVVDREAKHHPRARQLSSALQCAEREGIQVALSNPALEFWFVLHFELTTKSFADAAAVERRLKQKHLPGYVKNEPPLDELIPRLHTAEKNARSCLEHHEAGGGDGNPSTQMHLLVRSLNDSAAPGFRLMPPSPLETGSRRGTTR